MFTPAERDSLRTRIIDVARDDPHISGIAVTGSASVGKEDEWSDIDLAFGVEGDVQPVLDDFTKWMNQHGVADTLDVPSGPWIYRVFLLANTLQVDLAFVPEDHFGPRAETFRLIYGSANEVPRTEPPVTESVVRWGWLYAFHVRSSIKRGRTWQAVHMLNAFREQAITLACLRHGVPAREGRGVDRLPEPLLARLRETLPVALTDLELERAFRMCTALYLDEVRESAAHLYIAISEPLRRLLAEHLDSPS